MLGLGVVNKGEDVEEKLQWKFTLVMGTTSSYITFLYMYVMKNVHGVCKLFIQSVNQSNI